MESECDIIHIIPLTVLMETVILIVLVMHRSEKKITYSNPHMERWNVILYKIIIYRYINEGIALKHRLVIPT